MASVRVPGWVLGGTFVGHGISHVHFFCFSTEGKIMNIRYALFVGFIGISVGCVQQPKIVPIAAQFDANQAKRMLEDGKNKISGSALLRQNGGGVVTCAGNEVSLVPDTAYATERIQYIYNSTSSGFVDWRGYSFNNYKFSPDEPQYDTLWRKTICDAQGFFEFDKVADGKFYITTKVSWSVANVPQGGALMQKVSVSGGETKKIVMSGQ